ncbi:MAG: CBS domain-containing protein [Anaerolineae bacterium]|nr:CBS domain-containing protein [Anaerolineae bacterium]
MQVILTHENADFDAIASLLAAHKLYPNAKPVLPHRVNRNILAFLALYGPGFPFVNPDDLPRGQHVQRVILVDTPKLTFVRGMGKEIDQVTVIDHHPPPENRPPGWTFQSEIIGATTTLLVEAISTRLIPVSPAEATLMLAGIYEDTGNLTYISTTPRDLRAAAWLIDQGADLEVATQFMDHPLTAAQQAIFNGLRENAETLEIDGHPMVLSWAVSPPDTEEEISTLAHKMRDLLEPSALFVAVQIGENTQLVARSATDDINVGEVATHFGGGGHDRAAAALIHDRTARSVVDELHEILPTYVHPRIKVRDLMSYGVRTVGPEAAIKAVSDQMLRTGHEGFPVVDADNRLLGLVTRNAVDKAMQHGLSRYPVRRILQPGTVTVSPQDSMEHVRDLMIQTGWGQIPVAENDRVVGVVTRTDMIRLQPSSQTAERQKIAHLMEEAIPGPLLALIHEIGLRAADEGFAVYFVGGLVRDLLLGQGIFDVDLVVEGDAIELGRAMAMSYGGEIRSHRRFGTAKWLLPENIWALVRAQKAGDDDWRASESLSGRQFDAADFPDFIDLVTARTEFYEHPTALPMVSRSSIKQDLHRRDFTINTLAVRLDPQRWGELLDFYGGRADLEAGIIRVLHSLSFVDDPTRILRAARFEVRLGFKIEQRSEALIAEALPLLDRVAGERIRHEMDLIFEEAAPEAVLQRLQAVGALQHIHPGLRCDAWLSERYRRLSQAFVPADWGLAEEDRLQFYWAILLYRLDDKASEEVRIRLSLSHHFRDLHRAQSAVEGLVRELADADRVSTIAAQLDAVSAESLALMWLVSDEEEARRTLQRYSREWREVEPLLNGNDLKRLGYRPGPVYRDILASLKRARLDGYVSDRENEIAWVTEHFEPETGHCRP